MESIKDVISRSYTVGELFSCFELVKKNGDVAVIKFDGERATRQYTVFITFPASRSKEMIRADEDTIDAALLKVLKQYIKVE